MNPNKPRWHLLPWRSLSAVARLMSANAEKHGERGYETRDALEYQNAAQRHLAAMMAGEMTDAESGELHAVCLAANALIVAYHHDKILLHKEKRGATEKREGN